jgi:anthranilate synthase/aminodeoxychorismate synthase-like glutamine amidotransferase
LILIIDNFDSFTYILRDYFSQLNIESEVFRNTILPQEISNRTYKGIVISPGPGKPGDAGNVMEIISLFHKSIPILGICLGHQAIGEYFGARVIGAQKPMHGKVSEIIHYNDPVFKGVPEKINVVRYHSLIVDKLPSELTCLAKTTEDEIMAIRHEVFPVYGLQFHPEAILSECGKKIIENWLLLHKIAD